MGLEHWMGTQQQQANARNARLREANLRASSVRTPRQPEKPPSRWRRVLNWLRNRH
jgi:hypothetical protein